MSGRLEEACLGSQQSMTQAYDRRTDQAIARMTDAYREHAVEQQAFQSIISDGARDAAEWWDAVVNRSEVQETSQNQEEVPVARILAAEDDNDHDSRPQDRELKFANGIQKHLTKVIDALKLRTLWEKYVESGSPEDVCRLDDLMDVKNQDFSWWERLNTEVDRVLKAEDWVPAMRMMLGAKHLVADSVCGCCGQERLDVQCYHSLCCAGSEKTIGHN